MSARTSPSRGGLRRIAAAAALVAALALSGCSGLPMSGPVTAGDRSADETPDGGLGEYVVDGPSPGADPQQIVDGFLDAAISPAQGWATARRFLSPELAETWDPSAAVIIDRPAERVVSGAETTDDGADVSVRLSPAATLDEDGRYLLASGPQGPLRFELGRDAEGEWRITSAPDGIVLSAQYFRELFSFYDLQFFDPTWQYLVPERRWFVNRQDPVTSVVQQLVEGGPGDWIAPGVRTAFGSGMTVSRSGVGVDPESGIAQVSITGASGVAPQALARMRTQLEATLEGFDVSGVELTVDGQPVTVEAATPRSVRVDAKPLVLNESGFGFLSGGELAPLPGLSDAMVAFAKETPVKAIAVSPDQQVAAALADGGKAWRITAEGPSRIETGGGVVAPAIDPFGFVWTVRGDAPGSLAAWDADLVSIPLGDGWADQTEVRAIAMSRDGSRLAAISSIGDAQWVIVSTVQRNADGEPVALGEPLRVAQLRLPGKAITWLDPATVGVAAGSTDAAMFVQQMVGGPTDAVPMPLGVTTVTAGNQESSARLLTESGELQVLRGRGPWLPSGSGIEVLATQMGQPEG